MRHSEALPVHLFTIYIRTGDDAWPYESSAPIDHIIQLNDLANVQNEAHSAFRVAKSRLDSASRVCFLMLLSGFDVAAADALSKQKWLSQFPVFLQSLPESNEGSWTSAIEAHQASARQLLVSNPEFSIEVSALNDSRPIPISQESHFGVGFASTPDEDDLEAAGTASPATSRPRRLISSWVDKVGAHVHTTRERAQLRSIRRFMDSGTLPEPTPQKSLAVLLGIVLVDGPEATKTLRARQQRLVQGLAVQLGEDHRAWFMSAFHMGTDFSRVAPMSLLDPHQVSKDGSHDSSEVSLSTAIPQLESELELDIDALRRRGWRHDATCVLFLGADHPYLGVFPNVRLRGLTESIDLTCWVAEQALGVPLPAPLALPALQHRTMHRDIGHELFLLLQGCGSAEPAPMAPLIRSSISTPRTEEVATSLEVPGDSQ